MNLDMLAQRVEHLRMKLDQYFLPQGHLSLHYPTAIKYAVDTFIVIVIIVVVVIIIFITILIITSTIINDTHNSIDENTFLR